MFMLATNLLFGQLDSELRRATGIQSSQYEVLVRLSEAPERQLRMADLAEQSLSSRRVDPERGVSLSTGPFLRAALRTGRATLTASGSPPDPSKRRSGVWFRSTLGRAGARCRLVPVR